MAATLRLRAPRGAIWNPVSVVVGWKLRSIAPGSERRLAQPSRFARSGAPSTERPLVVRRTMDARQSLAMESSTERRPSRPGSDHPQSVTFVLIRMDASHSR